ncbi:hypothetical protein Q1W73_06955 [Asticcacaulis sp. ZE23SCel15]|uniref:hypothetical protein n=1 Tax=Asticcacaulis sp. ZE23SCel15 TaxID=3059027 RepID=UPI00265DA7F3|nr:hypothetical protein [Asticcacaulis sp. ZE23SCel15]WKL58718.1 hypothetical protein Q1W73_06955 [Asticcacaulis sp. ZE23SCel15]
MKNLEQHIWFWSIGTAFGLSILGYAVGGWIVPLMFIGIGALMFIAPTITVYLMFALIINALISKQHIALRGLITVVALCVIGFGVPTLYSAYSEKNNGGYHLSAPLTLTFTSKGSYYGEGPIELTFAGYRKQPVSE